MKFKSLTSILMAGMTMSQAFALPDPQADVSGITSKISMDGIGAVYGDHQNKTLLYVPPGDMKVIGQYVPTEIHGSCESIQNAHLITYGMPEPSKIQKMYQDNEYYSAYFSLTTMNMRHIDQNRRISELKEKTLFLKVENKELQGKYNRTLKAFESATKALDDEEKKYEKLKTDLTLDLATAATDAEKSEIKAIYRERKNKIERKVSELQNNKEIASVNYLEAYEDWQPIADQLANIQDEERILTDRHEKNFAEQKKFYNDALEMLDTLGNKITGYATVGYSLNSDAKVERLQKRLLEAGLSYSVQPLQIFNVAVNQPTSSSATIKTEGMDEEVEIGNKVDTSNSVAIGGTAEPIKLNATLEVNGETKDLSWDVKGFSNKAGASGSFKMPIKKGTICGTEEIVTSRLKLMNQDRTFASATVKYPVFKPAENRVVMAKNLPLTFNYYQKAEPLQGSCQMDVNQGSSYVRDHGKKKSGGLFNRKTKSWDHTKIDFKNDMGLNCELTKSPVGIDPEQSEMINNAFEKALYQDVYHMFIMAYGKDYEIVPVPKTELGEDSRFFSQVGSGVMNLCGKDKFCEFTGVVLKSMDELVGSRHTGSSSHTSSSTGRIRKDFKLNTYLISQGAANVEFKVCFDINSCN